MSKLDGFVPEPEPSTEQLVQELSAAFQIAHDVLKSLVRVVRRFERHAQSLTENPKVLLKLRPPPPTGPDGEPLPRRRGRPRGTRNGAGGTLTLYADATQIAALRSLAAPDAEA